MHKRQCADAQSTHISAFHLLRWHCVHCFASISFYAAHRQRCQQWLREGPTHTHTPNRTGFLHFFCHSSDPIERNRLLGMRWRVIDQMHRHKFAFSIGGAWLGEIAISRLASVGLKSTTHHAVKIWQQKRHIPTYHTKAHKIELKWRYVCVCVVPDDRPWSFYLFQYGLAAMHFTSSAQRLPFCEYFFFIFYFHILFSGMAALHKTVNRSKRKRKKNINVNFNRSYAAAAAAAAAAHWVEFKKLEWLNGPVVVCSCSHSIGILCARENQKWKEEKDIETERGEHKINKNKNNNIMCLGVWDRSRAPAFNTKYETWYDVYK